MYEYKTKILRIVDGDTIDVEIDLGFGIQLQRVRIRVNGIDCPETRTSDKIEKKYGQLAKEYAQTILPINSIQTLKTENNKTDKFGRVLGDFLVNENTFSKVMVEAHHAVEYNGENKETIAKAHEINRTKLSNRV